MPSFLKFFLTVILIAAVIIYSRIKEKQEMNGRMEEFARLAEMYTNNINSYFENTCLIHSACQKKVLRNYCCNNYQCCNAITFIIGNG